MARYLKEEKTGVGPRIREQRKQRGWSQAKLADMLHIERNTLGMKESGKRAFTPEELLLLSDAFGITVDEMLTGIKTQSWNLHKDLGLDDSAIDTFRFFAEKYPPEYREYLNKALSSPSILEALAQFMSVSNKGEGGRFLETSYSYDENMYVCKMTPSVFDSVVSYNLLTLLEAVRSDQYITVTAPDLTGEQADIMRNYLRGDGKDAEEK